jgi:hypothetical protein
MGIGDVFTESLPGVQDIDSDAEPLELDGVFHVLLRDRRRPVEPTHSSPIRSTTCGRHPSPGSTYE